MKQWITKNKIAITFISILSICLVFVGIFIPIDTYEPDCGIDGGNTTIVRHELIFGGSLDGIKKKYQSKPTVTTSVIKLYPYQCTNGRESHKLFLL